MTAAAPVSAAPSAWDPDARAWRPEVDPLAGQPVDVGIDLLPAPLAADEVVRRVADVVSGEVGRVTASARLLAGLSRVAERGAEAPPRALLDEVAHMLGVDFYSPRATDDDVLDLVYGAAEWHLHSGTPWAVRWALERVGQDVAGGADGDAGGAVDPAQLGDGATIEVVEQGSARYAFLESRLPAVTSPVESFVVVDLERVDDDLWGAWIERAVRLSSLASRQPTWVVYFGGRTEGDVEAALFYAKLALGRSYEYSTLPVLDGSRTLDGSWTLAPDAVVARPTDRPASGEPPPPKLFLVALAPGSVTLRAERGGRFSVRRVPVSFRGLDYTVSLARPRPFGLVFGAGATVLRDGETATGLPGSRSLVLTVEDPPALPS